MPLIATLLLAASACVAQPIDGSPQTVHTLDNGVRVIVLPIPGSGAIGVETFYRAGFVDEPLGLAHSAHLIEHLVSMAGADGLEPGQACRELNEGGMTNAETLATFTHYDYAASADRLDRILEVEAARLSSLRITPEIIAQESPRCIAELRTLEVSPAAHVGKFATMALLQVLHHGADSVNLDLAARPIDAAALQALHASLYRPDTLTVVIAGDVSEAAALELARRRLAGIAPRAEPARRAPFSFAMRVDADPIQATWDGAHEIGAIAFPPPQTLAERFVIGFWSATVSFLARQEPAIASSMGSIATADTLTLPGDLPIFFMGAATDDQSTGWNVTGHLADHVFAQIDSGAAARTIASQTEVLAQQLEGRTEITPALIELQAEVFQRMGHPIAHARALVLANVALQLGILDETVGLENRAALAADLRAMDADDISDIVRRHIAPDRMVTLRLRPDPRRLPAPGGQP